MDEIWKTGRPILVMVDTFVIGHHLDITYDEWSDCANGTHMFAVHTFIHVGWEVVVISPYSSRHDGTTIGEGFAVLAVVAIERNGLYSQVTAITSDG